MKRQVCWRKMFFSFGMICFLMLLVSACTPGNGPAPTTATKSWGTATLIETNDSGAAIKPQVTFDAFGNAVAVWMQYDDVSGRYNIWSNRYTASNGLWGTAVAISNNMGSAQSPQVAVDANGNAIAVWHQDDGRTNIYSNRYTASTGLWGTAALLETNDAGFASNPQIAIDADGNAIVVWYQNVGYPYNIWSNRYTALTNSWSGAARIETNTAGNAVYPQVAIDASGNAVAVWQQYDDVASRYDIWSNRYTASTGLWGTAALIETDNAGWAIYPQVAVDANGNAVAVWYQSDGTRYNIWSNRYTASTGLWGTAALIETDNAGNANDPQVAIDANGNAVAVWYQSDGTRTNIWSNSYTASTGLWGTAVLIETDNAGNANDPQVAIDANGNAMAVWRQSDGTRTNIWSNRYTASTGLWGTAVLLETDNTGDANDPQVAIDTNGNAVAIWRQTDGTRMNVWTNMYR